MQCCAIRHSDVLEQQRPAVQVRVPQRSVRIEALGRRSNSERDFEHALEIDPAMANAKQLSGKTMECVTNAADVVPRGIRK